MNRNSTIIGILIITLTMELFAQSPPDSGYIRLQLPPNIYLEMGDSLIPHLNRDILPVPPGPKSLMVRPQSHRSWYLPAAKRSLTVQTGDTVSLPFTRADLLYEVPPPYKTVDLNTSILDGSTGKDFRLKKLVKPALLVTTVAANWAAFYLRRRADAMYSQYQATSDISELNHYYDKASTYDKYASTALGVSIAAGTTLLFVLIFED